jgi:hypothetical protein
MQVALQLEQAALPEAHKAARHGAARHGEVEHQAGSSAACAAAVAFCDTSTFTLHIVMGRTLYKAP